MHEKSKFRTSLVMGRINWILFILLVLLIVSPIGKKEGEAPLVLQGLIAYWAMSGPLAIIAIILTLIQNAKGRLERKEFILDLCTNIGYLVVYSGIIRYLSYHTLSV